MDTWIPWVCAAKVTRIPQVFTCLGWTGALQTGHSVFSQGLQLGQLYPVEQLGLRCLLPRGLNKLWERMLI